MSFNGASISLQNGNITLNQNNDEENVHCNSNEGYNNAHNSWNTTNNNSPHTQLTSNQIAQNVEQDADIESDAEGQVDINNMNQEVEHKEEQKDNQNTNDQPQTTIDKMYDQLIQDQNEGAFGSDNNNDTNNNNDDNSGKVASQNVNNQCKTSNPYSLSGAFCIECKSVNAFYECLDKQKSGSRVLVIFYDIKNKYCEHLRGTLDIVNMNYPQIKFLCVEMAAADFLIATYQIFIKPTVFLIEKDGNIINRKDGLEWVIPFGDHWDYRADYLEHRMIYVGLLPGPSINTVNNTFYAQTNQSKNPLLVNDSNKNIYQTDDDDNNEGDDDEDDMMDID